MFFILEGEKEKMISKGDEEDTDGPVVMDAGGYNKDKFRTDFKPEYDKEGDSADRGEMYRHSIEASGENSPTSASSFRPGLFKRLSSYEGAIFNTQLELDKKLHCHGSNYLESTTNTSCHSDGNKSSPTISIHSTQGNRNGNNNFTTAYSDSKLEGLQLRVIADIDKEVSTHGDQETSLITISDSDCSPRSPDSRRLTVDSGIFLCGNEIYGNDQKPKQHSNFKTNHVMQAS